MEAADSMMPPSQSALESRPGDKQEHIVREAPADRKNTHAMNPASAAYTPAQAYVAGKYTQDYSEKNHNLTNSTVPVQYTSEYPVHQLLGAHTIHSQDCSYENELDLHRNKALLKKMQQKFLPYAYDKFGHSGFADQMQQPDQAQQLARTIMESSNSLGPRTQGQTGYNGNFGAARNDTSRFRTNEFRHFQEPGNPQRQRQIAHVVPTDPPHDMAAVDDNNSAGLMAHSQMHPVDMRFDNSGFRGGHPAVPMQNYPNAYGSKRFTGPDSTHFGFNRPGLPLNGNAGGRYPLNPPMGPPPGEEHFGRVNNSKRHDHEGSRFPGAPYYAPGTNDEPYPFPNYPQRSGGNNRYPNGDPFPLMYESRREPIPVRNNVKQVPDATQVAARKRPGEVAVAAAAAVQAKDPDNLKAIYEELGVLVDGIRPTPQPVLSFAAAPFPDWMIQELQQRYTAPYPVQAAGWPLVATGRDIVGTAKTGSGKTLAFLLPGIMRLWTKHDTTSDKVQGEQSNKRGSPAANRPRNEILHARNGPYILVLAPTRELAQQIDKEAQFFSNGPQQVRLVCLFGGVPRWPQATTLKHGCHLCTATPGRLLDFLQTGQIHLRSVTYLVVDEADRMLDMGFEPQVREIVNQMRYDRQTVMWSATWPREAQKFGRDLCRQVPLRLAVGSPDLQANPDITQNIRVCNDADRFPQLVHLLAHSIFAGQLKRILIFVETKRGCDELRDRLQAYAATQERTCGAPPGWLRLSVIHGDKVQKERSKSLFDFKSGRCNVLIATDVASRGLDIKGVDLLINFSVPKTVEDYVHRIGRTGRAGNQGTAITLFSIDNDDVTGTVRMARDIADVMTEAGQQPPQELLDLLSRAPGALRGNPNRYPTFRGGNPRGGFFGSRGGGLINRNVPRNNTSRYGFDFPNRGGRGGRGSGGRGGAFRGGAGGAHNENLNTYNEQYEHYGNNPLKNINPNHTAQLMWQQQRQE